MVGRLLESATKFGVILRKGMLLSMNQYAILNSCANGWELFYFIFAEVNFGGQLFIREPGGAYAQHVDDKKCTVRVQARELFPDIVELSNRKLLACWGEIKKIHHPVVEDFLVYTDYACKTFDEHIAQYGYGPHEFQTTQRGIGEINRVVYRYYDRGLDYVTDEEDFSRRKDEIVAAARQALGVELHSETEVSKLLSIPRRSLISISRFLGVGTNITHVRYFSEDEINRIRHASQAHKEEQGERSLFHSHRKS
jgi:hypothetical protein